MILMMIHVWIHISHPPHKYYTSVFKLIQIRWIKSRGVEVHIFVYKTSKNKLSLHKTVVSLIITGNKLQLLF